MSENNSAIGDADHHEVKIYYDGEPVAIASGPTPCAELMGNLLTEMIRKGLAHSMRSSDEVRVLSHSLNFYSTQRSGVVNSEGEND